MAKRKTTKRALFMSLVSMILCCAMFIGTTFAWFTDSVTSQNNIIQAGNLDVELEYYDVENQKWNTVDSKTLLFDEEALWEPGRTEVVYLKVRNAGTLALKYQLGVNVVKEIGGKNVEGGDIVLSEHIKFGVIENGYENEELYDNRADARKAVTDSKLISEGYSKEYNSLMPKGSENDEEYVTLVVYMPEEVGNEANYRGTQVPTITLGINLFATQFTYERDSYDNQYDKDAPNTTVATVDELKSAIEEGKSVALASDMEIDSVITFGTYSGGSENKEVTIDLMGNCLSLTKSASLLQVMSGNTLNIIDTAENGTLKIDATALITDMDMGKSHTAPILATADAVINLDSVNIEIDGNTSSAIGTSNSEATINVNDCEVTVADTCSAVHMENGILNMKNTKINMKSGATSAITVDQINMGNAVKLYLDNSVIQVDDTETPVVDIVKYNVDITHSELEYNGTNLYKTNGNGYTRIITVNGEVQE